MIYGYGIHTNPWYTLCMYGIDIFHFELTLETILHFKYLFRMRQVNEVLAVSIFYGRSEAVHKSGLNQMQIPT